MPLVAWRDQWDKWDTFPSASDSQHSHSTACRIRVGSGALQEPLSDSPLGYISGIGKKMTLKSSKSLAPIQTQFSSVTQTGPTLSDPTDYSALGFPVHHQLTELTQIHVHWVDDAIQPFHPLSSSSPLAFNLSQHQGLFQWVSSSHQVAKVLELQLQHQCFQLIFKTDFL